MDLQAHNIKFCSKPQFSKLDFGPDLIFLMFSDGMEAKSLGPKKEFKSYF